MSDYLELLVLSGPEALDGTGGVYPHSILEVLQNYSIIGQILDLSWRRSDARPDIPVEPIVKTRPIPEDFWLCWYFTDGEEKVRKDPCGDELRWAPAEEFKKLVVPESASPLHKALKAYIDQLPNDVPIVLWHH